MEMITPMAPRKIALLTDSTADLTTQVAEENHIHVVPLRIRCADGEYSDGVDIHAADIYARLRAGELPKTSLPAGEDITAAFDRIRDEGYDGVIAVMLSGGLSGTYNMTRLLAEERRDLEIKVYDSVSGSLGIGVTMLQLAEDLRAGASWRELTHKRVPQLIKNTFPFFSVDTLEYLQRGGRSGKVTAMAGTLLQIKPRITVAVHRQGARAETGHGQAHRSGGEGLRESQKVQSGRGQRRGPGGDGRPQGKAEGGPPLLRPYLGR